MTSDSLEIYEPLIKDLLYPTAMMQGRMYGNEKNRTHEHWFASYRFTHDTEQIGIKIC